MFYPACNWMNLEIARKSMFELACDFCRHFKKAKRDHHHCLFDRFTRVFLSFNQTDTCSIDCTTLYKWQLARHQMPPSWSSLQLSLGLAIFNGTLNAPVWWFNVALVPSTHQLTVKTNLSAHYQNQHHYNWLYHYLLLHVSKFTLVWVVQCDI